MSDPSANLTPSPKAAKSSGSDPLQQGLTVIRGLVGAAVGATAGFFLFWGLLRQGLYAMIVPGALLGIGCGLLSGRRSYLLAVICGVLGLGFGIWTESYLMPFVVDESFGFFLKNLFQLPSSHLVMFACGSAAAAWFGLGRRRGYL